MFRKGSWKPRKDDDASKDQSQLAAGEDTDIESGTGGNWQNLYEAITMIISL